MRKAIFITVRKDSTRLPNKAIKKILNRPVIEMIIIRAKKALVFDEIVVCTTEREIDDEIVMIADRNNVKIFRGSTEDKLARWLGATRKYSIDLFVTMDGDDLFCDPELMELGAKQIEEFGYDFIKAPKGLACGGFTYAIRTTALEKVCDIKDTDDTEMQWVYFEDTGLFKVAELDVKNPIYFGDDIRLTLDYEEDFNFFENVLEKFKAFNNDVPLADIMAFLKLHPEIVEINSFRQQDWSTNQQKKTKLILKETVNDES